MHGTRKHHVAQIFSKGLKPGGRRGMSHRAHVTLVECLEGSGEIAGARGGSDCVVKVDMHLLFQHGADIFKEKTMSFSRMLCGETAMEIVSAFVFLRDSSWIALTSGIGVQSLLYLFQVWTVRDARKEQLK